MIPCTNLPFAIGMNVSNIIRIYFKRFQTTFSTSALQIAGIQTPYWKKHLRNDACYDPTTLMTSSSWGPVPKNSSRFHWFNLTRKQNQWGAWHVILVFKPLPKPQYTLGMQPPNSRNIKITPPQIGQLLNLSVLSLMTGAFFSSTTISDDPSCWR